MPTMSRTRLLIVGTGALTTGKQASRGRGVVGRFDGHPLCASSAGPTSGQQPAASSRRTADLRKHRAPSSTEGRPTLMPCLTDHGLIRSTASPQPVRSSLPSSRLMMMGFCPRNQQRHAPGDMEHLNSEKLWGNGTRPASRFRQARTPVWTKHQRRRPTPGCRSGTGASDDQA